MLEDLKKIKLEEISNKIDSLKNELNNLEEEVGKYSKFQILVTKKKEYNEKKSIVAKRKVEIDEEIAKLLEDKEKIEEATNILNLVDSFNDAVSLLQDNKIVPSLTLEDKESVEGILSFAGAKDVGTLDGVILVHKQKYFPDGNELKSVAEGNYSKQGVINVAGEEFKVSNKLSRNTVHFCANSEVESHFWGNWDDCKYAILIPLKDVYETGNIESMKPGDTFTEGGVKLNSNTWILVPKGEAKKVNNSLSNANVIEYEGDSVRGYANTLITLLGYQREQNDKDTWLNYNDANKFYDLSQKLGCKSERHCSNVSSVDEQIYTKLSVVTSLLDEVSKRPELLENDTFCQELVSSIVPIFPNNSNASFDFRITINEYLAKINNYFIDNNKNYYISDSIIQEFSQCNQNQPINKEETLQIVNDIVKNVRNGVSENKNMTR